MDGVVLNDRLLHLIVRPKSTSHIRSNVPALTVYNQRQIAANLIASFCARIINSVLPPMNRCPSRTGTHHCLVLHVRSDEARSEPEPTERFDAKQMHLNIIGELYSKRIVLRA